MVRGKKIFKNLFKFLLRAGAFLDRDIFRTLATVGIFGDTVLVAFSDGIAEFEISANPFFIGHLTLNKDAWSTHSSSSTSSSPFGLRDGPSAGT
jgi:hypothetical protein